MGGSSSSSKPKDMTPTPFKDLQQPFADTLSDLLKQYDKSDSNKILATGYKGPYTAGIGSGEQQALTQLQNYTQQNVGQPAGGSGGTPATTTGSQTQDDLLKGLMQTGSSAGSVKDFVDQLGIGGAPKSSLSDFMSQLTGASGTGAFSGDANNPLMQAYIQAAQRQTQQGLEETLSRTLPGRFALAGQRTQPGQSSAFDRAAAIATRGAADAMGDIATKISYQSLQEAQNREAAALGEELSRRGATDLQTQQLTAAAQQQQMDRSLGAAQQETAARAQQTTEKATNAQITSQEVDNMVKNLQAQALPRLIEDMGIERGMEAFNSRVNSILAGLGIASGTTRPVVSSESKSSSFQLK